MSSRSRKSNNTSQSTQSTMDQHASGRTDNSVLMGQQSQMQDSMLGSILPIFGSLIENGTKMMADNPGMANFVKSVGGLPIQLGAPDFLQEFITKYNPPKPEQTTQQQRFGAMPPSTPQFNVNNYMRNRFMGPRR